MLLARILLLFLSVSSSVRVRISRITGTSERGHQKGSRVFADVDDTLKCAGRQSFSGMDINCNKHGEIYPGALNFMLALSRGPKENKVTYPAKVVPLSARPKQLKFLLALTAHGPLSKAFRKLSKAENALDWGLDIADAQYGSILNVKSVVEGRFEAGLSKKKFDAWLAYNSSVPSYFIGDNGQGDVLAAEMMVARQDNITFKTADKNGDGRIDKEEFIAFMSACKNYSWGMIYHQYSGNLARKEEFLKFLDHTEKGCKYIQGTRPYLTAAFIHHVQYTAIASTSLETFPNSQRKGLETDLKQKGIFLFSQYGHAACIAYEQAYISDAAYTRIMLAIKQECFAKARSMVDVLNHPRVACRVLAPEFDIKPIDPKRMTSLVNISVRAASDCQQPLQFRKVQNRQPPSGVQIRKPKKWVAVPALLRGLTAKDFFPLHGYWAVEKKCHAIDESTPNQSMDDGTLARLSHAMFLLQKHGDKAVNQGVPYMLRWVMKIAGLHCLTRCRYTCFEEMKYHEKAWGKTFTNFDTNESFRWQLHKVRHAPSRMGSCRAGTRTICQMKMNILEPDLEERW